MLQTFEPVGDRKVNTKFEQDVAAFLMDDVRGNLWPYIYGWPETPDDPVRGGIHYNNMLREEKEYYL